LIGGNLMNKNHTNKLPTTQNDPNQALWTELSDEVAAELGGGGRVGGSIWAKCQVPGKCEVGGSLVVKF
jgi:hypothetical protein